ncbi:hypothetical protein EW026_g2254 [Hermanssonia centrifuga]|uniref:endo-polygalacturonase n=1 Tax=Hermanssonia centrifuga TaxID=98765 RepID=A0A4S4KTI1_9APHY|nr:hypothetical protein EW026_g2254 [Hermanssonia centrifuga]
MGVQSTIKNQDDCLAINKGSNIVFQGNTCSGGHGISIGSVASGATVSGIVISGNTIVNNDQALRIKTDSDATSASVTNVTYSGNTATGMRQFGILIDQSYPDTLGTPGTGVKISGINFSGSKTSISVNSGAQRVAVNCGKGACTGLYLDLPLAFAYTIGVILGANARRLCFVGTWDWSELSVTGGSAGEIVNFSGIENFSQ